MKELDAYPSILKSKRDCFLMVHVDNLLIVGSKDVVMKELIPSLKSKYGISIELIPNLEMRSPSSRELTSSWGMAEW